ncbi:MAG: uracil-DNA glycosylase family protein [Verrucomicrobiota bacterium]
MQPSQQLVAVAESLCREMDSLSFGDPVTHVYNPLSYAWEPHRLYLEKYGNSEKRVVFMGMNPGPGGMSQTGVPFGEIAAVRDWMGIEAPVSKPANEHPKRLIEGFDCDKSEVSGRRLWGLFADRFERPERFFAEHFVINYCPLVFMEESARNRTPDKIPAAEMDPVHAACGEALRANLEALKPEWIVGVGGYAEKRLETVLPALSFNPRVGRVLHPSPASPAANRGWAEAVEKQMVTQKIWPS